MSGPNLGKPSYHAKIICPRCSKQVSIVPVDVKDGKTIWNVVFMKCPECKEGIGEEALRKQIEAQAPVDDQQVVLRSAMEQKPTENTPDMPPELFAYYDGARQMIQVHAWWKDGVQHVGSMGDTLAEVLERIDAAQEAVCPISTMFQFPPACVEALELRKDNN